MIPIPAEPRVVNFFSMGEDVWATTAHTQGGRQAMQPISRVVVLDTMSTKPYAGPLLIA